VFVNNIPFVTNVNLASEKPNLESLNYIRFYGPSKDGVPCYIAFDNTRIRAYESYSVTSVCSENGSDEISTADKAIKIYLSENINPDTLDESKIIIKNDNKILHIAQVLYDEEKKCITVKLKDVLIGGKKYTIELSDTIETAFGEQLKSTLNSHFMVKSNQKLFVINTEQNNDSITLNVTASENINAYIIAAVWDADQCKGETITPVLISADDIMDVDIHLPFAESKDVVELYVVENLLDFEMLTDDIVTVIAQ